MCHRFLQSDINDFNDHRRTLEHHRVFLAVTCARRQSHTIPRNVWNDYLQICLRYYEHLFLFCMLKMHVTSLRFCWNLPNIYHFTYTFSHAHTEAHTHKHTCTISTQEEWRQPGTGACLREVEERLCLRPCTHKKKCQEKPDIHEFKEKIRAHRASSKATRLFLTK